MGAGQRIEAIVDKKRFIRLRNWDAEKFILNYIPRLPLNTLVYCDPPYFNKSDKLYQNHYMPSDHIRIAGIIQNYIKHPWVVSYDNNDTIMSLYKKCNKFIYKLQYNAAKAYEGVEIFVFSEKTKIPCKSSILHINQSLEAINCHKVLGDVSKRNMPNVQLSQIRRRKASFGL
jgi:DNA adenine methylase